MTGYTAKVGLRQPKPHAWDGCKVCVTYIVRRYGSVAAGRGVAYDNGGHWPPR